MAEVITSQLTYRKCEDISKPLQGYVNDPLSAITSGTTYFYRGSCYEITNVIRYGTSTEPTITFSGGPYNDCRECYGANYDYVAATDCISDQTYYFEFTGFTGTPLINEVYFIPTIDRGDISYNCYNMVSYGTYDPMESVGYTTIVDTPTLSTGCDPCLNSSFLTYEVTPCLGSGTYNVGLSSNSYSNHLISFIDASGDQRCGVVGESPIVRAQDGTFISDYGLFEDYGGDATCDECNSQVAEQRILTNCITGEDEIVWNSLFFNGGESSNLSSADGCFSVGEIVTGETVTINEFLNFDPQPNCQECIQCNGIQYNYTTCNGTGPIGNTTNYYTGTSVLTDFEYILTGNTNGNGQYARFYVQVVSNTINNISIVDSGISYATGDTITILGSNFEGGISPDDDIIVTVDTVSSSQSVVSYQYLENPVGVIFYNPIINECCEVTSSEAPTSGVYTLYSLNTFETCLDCINQNHYVWYGVDCDGTLGGIAVTTGVGFGVGDIVKIKQGDSDFLCVELTDVYNYGVHGPLNSYNSLTIDSYSTCDECKGTVRIGVSVLSCETNEVSYVNIPLNTWYAVAGYSLVFEGLILSDYQGNCYTVINACPINVVGNNLDVQHIFTSCSVCYDFYNPIIHVNQYYETIIVGPDGGGQVVTFNTPHPIWTDGSDTRRTLIQDNAVTLGGFNGLNN